MIKTSTGSSKETVDGDAAMMEVEQLNPDGKCRSNSKIFKTLQYAVLYISYFKFILRLYLQGIIYYYPDITFHQVKR